MIEATEVRRGNYILYPHGQDWVECISYDMDRGDESPLVIDGFALDELNPIPLTPEILEKCGFKKMSSTTWQVFRSPEVTMRYIDVTGSLVLLQDATDCISIPNVNTLHRLQNIIHSITGTELEYKP